MESRDVLDDSEKRKRSCFRGIRTLDCPARNLVATLARILLLLLLLLLILLLLIIFTVTEMETAVT
jgi:hypothetical protein